MRKIFTKYIVLLAVYLVISRLLYTFGFKIYYNLIEEPQLTTNLMNQIQMILSGISSLFGLGIAIIMFFDLKGKKLLEWVIIILTIFYPSFGIGFFLIRHLMIDMDNTWHNKKYT